MARGIWVARHVAVSVIVVLCVAGMAAAQSGRAFIEGYVIGDRELVGLEGATVELVGDPKAPYVRGVRMSTTTDGDGKYAMTEIRHGPYTLTVSLAGYATYRIPIYMLSDNLTKLHVQLNKVRPPTRRSKHRTGT